VSVKDQLCTILETAPAQVSLYSRFNFFLAYAEISGDVSITPALCGKNFHLGKTFEVSISLRRGGLICAWPLLRPILLPGQPH